NLGSARSFSEVSDGLSNSLFLAERGIMDISQRERVQGGFADGGANTPGDTTVGTGGGNGGWVHRFRIDDAMAMANGTKYVPNVSLSSGTLLNSGKYISWRVANSAFDSQAGGNRFHTILKPNGPSVQPLDSDDTPNAVRIYAANSYHTAGVNTVFGDGSVHFVSDTINTMSAEWNGAAFTGDTIVTFHDSYFSGASPFGVWGALGAINDGQAVSIP
ncbi:MAG: DUF1559 domain-containing protein, partial [Planctomycetaceae bacterium]|nr:DUF1559 domain-containing protein [Planctomycetaceae bacterium]